MEVRKQQFIIKRLIVIGILAGLICLVGAYNNSMANAMLLLTIGGIILVVFYGVTIIASWKKTHIKSIREDNAHDKKSN